MSAPAKHFLVQQADVSAQSKKETKVVCSHSTGRPITSMC
jgi:hypothetical protein